MAFTVYYRHRNNLDFNFSCRIYNRKLVETTLNYERKKDKKQAEELLQEWKIEYLGI